MWFPSPGALVPSGASMIEPNGTVELSRWPEFFYDWAEVSNRTISGSPERSELVIEGECSRKGAGGARFIIGSSRDPYGSALKLAPGEPKELLEDGNAKSRESNLRKWSQWWAKIAVRAGYMMPVIDPLGFARLSSLRRDNVRVEFIVDTNVLIGGIGHWLVRWLGDRADLVRAVVTDLELQRFADSGIWRVEKFEHLDRRTSYLCACRFLEYLNDRHPIWRRIDTAEETALFTARASDGSKKDPGSDTLLLRAARRLIQDEVPGLVRLFVTADQALARAATHELPGNSTIAAYVNPIPPEGVYLGPLHWWPGGTEGQGQGCLATLADFLYEATCLCDRVYVRKNNGATLALSGYVPNANQFPSDWRRPLVWYDTSATASAPVESVKIVTGTPRASTNTEKPAQITIDTRSDDNHSRREGENPWPLRPTRLLDKNECAARVQPVHLFNAVAAIMVAEREKRKVVRGAFDGAGSSVREIKTFLRCTELLDEGDVLGAAAHHLPEIFEKNDVDGLSELFTAASHYAHLIRGLKEKSALSSTSAGVPDRAFHSLAAVARFLGQAVQVEREIRFGGAHISQGEFQQWLSETMASAGTRGPLGGITVAEVARLALDQLHLSPARFERALDATLKLPAMKDIETISGGTPEDVLVEHVVILSSEGWRERRVSADGLLGYRTLQWSTQ